MNRIKWIPVILVWLLTGCSGLPQSDSRKVESLVEASLIEEFGYLIQRDGVLVIRDDLSIFMIEGIVTRETFLAGVQGNDPRLWEAACDYWDKNQRDLRIKDLGIIPLSHVVVGEGWKGMEVKEWLADFDKVREEYAGPVLTISYPGFSSDGTVAVIYLSHSYGGLYAGGKTLVFEYEDGEWKRSELSAGYSWRA